MYTHTINHHAESSKTLDNKHDKEERNRKENMHESGVILYIIIIIIVYYTCMKFKNMIQ